MLQEADCRYQLIKAQSFPTLDINCGQISLGPNFANGEENGLIRNEFLHNP